MFLTQVTEWCHWLSAHLAVHWAPADSGEIAHWIEALATASGVIVAVITFVIPDKSRRVEEERNAVRMACELLGPIANLKWELGRADLFSRNRQIDWMISVQRINLESLRAVPFRYLRAGRGEDDVYFTWVICDMTLDSLLAIRSGLCDAAEAEERIAAVQRRARDRLQVISSRSK